MDDRFDITIEKVVAGGWFLFAAYALIYRCIILGQSINAVPAIFAVIMGFVALKNCRAVINIIGIIVLFIGYFNLVGLVLFKTIYRRDPLTASCYSFDIQYVKSQHSNRETFLPDKLPSDAHDASFEFLPSMLQGDGYANVFFETSPENVEKYIAYYSDKTVLPPFSLAALHNETYSQNEVHLTIPAHIQANYPNAKIYVIYSNFNWNHPYTQAFICDVDSGLVGFCEGA